MVVRLFDKLWMLSGSSMFAWGQVREREEEISTLLLRVSASEGRSRRLAEDKETQLRYVYV